jgi:hypothetical protein
MATGVLANVRALAVERLTDTDLLTSIAAEDPDPGVREYALDRLESLQSPGAEVGSPPREAGAEVEAAEVGVEAEASEAGLDREMGRRLVRDSLDGDKASRTLAARRLARLVRYDVGGAAWRLLQAEIAGAVLQSPDPDVRLPLLQATVDPAALATIALGAKAPETAVMAVGRISEDAALVRIAREAHTLQARVAATERLEDQGALDPDGSLREVARQERDRRTRLTGAAVRQAQAAEAVRNASSTEEALSALQWVSDPKILEDIASMHPDPQVRGVAQERLDAYRLAGP